MFSKLSRSRRNRDNRRNISLVKRRRNRTRSLIGCEQLESRQLLAATVLPFIATAEFNQFTGSTGTQSIGFGIDAPGITETEPKFLGFEFKETYDVGGFTPGFRSGTRWGAQADIDVGSKNSSDTSGLNADGTFKEDGRLGIEYGYFISKGQGTIVNEGDFQYEVTPVAGQDGAFNLITGTNVTENTLQTVSPTISAYADLVIDIGANIAGEACAGILGCADGETGVFGVDEKFPLFSINRETEASTRTNLDFDGNIKVLEADFNKFGDKLVDLSNEGKDQASASDVALKKAQNDFVNATDDDERTNARIGMDNARKAKAQAEADQAEAKKKGKDTQDVEEDKDKAGIGLKLAPASNGLLGVTASASASATISGVTISKPLGDFTVTLPEVNLTDTASGDADLSASTRDKDFDKNRTNLAKLNLNLGTLISDKIPFLGTTSVSVGPLSASITTLEYTLGAGLDVTQDIKADFDREIVTATFTNGSGTAINVTASGTFLSNSGNEIKFLKGSNVRFDPVGDPGEVEIDFSLERVYDVSNNIGLNFNLGGDLKALAASASVSLGRLNKPLFNIGPLITHSHELYDTDIPILDPLEYEATSSVVLPRQTVTLGPDISIKIANQSEVIVDDAGFDSHRDFSFDVVVDNIGLKTADSVVINVSDLDILGGLAGNLTVPAGWTPNAANGTATITLSNVAPDSSQVFTFSGKTSDAGGTTYEALAVATLSGDADASNNNATNALGKTSIPVLASRRFFVGSGGDGAFSGDDCADQDASACTLREAVFQSQAFSGIQPTVVEIESGVSDIFITGGAISLPLRPVVILGQGSDVTTIHDSAFQFSNVTVGTMRDLRLLGGDAVVATAVGQMKFDGVRLEGMSGTQAGAIIATSGTNLLVQNSMLIGNTATQAANSAGAISHTQNGDVTIRGSEFRLNTSPVAGALFFSNVTGGGTNDVVIEDSTFTENSGGSTIAMGNDRVLTANSLITYHNTGDNFSGIDPFSGVDFAWEDLVNQRGAGYVETNIAGPVTRDIGVYDESTNGGISYEFVYTAPDTTLSRALMGSGQPPLFGDSAALKLEQFNTGKYGVTKLGVVDILSDVDQVVDEPAHVVFVANGVDMDLYVNGVFAETIDNASVNLSGVVGVGQIFRHNLQAGSDLLGGTIHGLAVYDRALADFEVERHAKVALSEARSSRIVSDDTSATLGSELGPVLQSANVDSLVSLSFPLVLADTPGETIGEVFWQSAGRAIVSSEAVSGPGNTPHPQFEIVDGFLKLKSGVSLPDNGTIIEVNIRGTDDSGRTLIDSVLVRAESLPAAPINLNVDVLPGDGDDVNNFINVDWEHVIDGVQQSQVELNTQYIVRAIASDGSDSQVILLDIGLTTQEAIEGFVNLQFDKDYVFSVEARNAIGSAPVASVTKRTLIAPPTRFENVSASETVTSVSFEWDDTDRESEYQIFQDGVLVETFSNTANATRLSRTFAATPDTVYVYEIHATNVSGTSTATITIESDMLEPTPPTDVRVRSTSATSARFDWSDSRNESEYQILGRLAGETEYSSMIDVTEVPATDNAALDNDSGTRLVYEPIPAGTTSYVVEGLQAGSEYEFLVVAINEDHDVESSVVNFSNFVETPILLVTSVGDAVSNVDFQTSLREAISLANSPANGGDADGDGSPHDTITFDDEGAFAAAATILLNSELQIMQSLTIVGADGAIVSGRDQHRIFNVTGSADLTLRGLHLTDGLSRQSSTVQGDNFGLGGAIIANNGMVKLVDSRISSSIATSPTNALGGAIHSSATVELVASSIDGNIASGASAKGGGVSAKNIRLTNSLIDQNSAVSTSTESQGGGLYADGRITMIESTVSSNFVQGGAQNSGGGIASSLVTSGGGVSLSDLFGLEMTRSVVKDNHTDGINSPGGGVYLPNASLKSVNSTISGNYTDGSNSDGGGVFASSVRLINTTVAANQARGTSSDGGGVSATSINLTSATVTSNAATGTGGGVHSNAVRLSNSIVAGNFGMNGTNDVSDATPELVGENVINLGGNSLFEDLLPVVLGGVLGVDGGQLGDNGVTPTLNSTVQTVALDRNNEFNPALDANPFDPILSPVSTDARGFDRSFDLPGIGSSGDTMDAGAFEVGALLIVDSLVDTDNLAGFQTLREAIVSANEQDGPDRIVFADSLSGQAINLTSQLPVITEELIVDASSLDSRLTVSGGNAHRILEFDGPGDLEINGLVLTAGRTTGNNTSSTNTFSGGAIHFDSSAGVLRLTHSVVSNSSTMGTYAGGGAIFASDTSQTILTNSDLINNHTEGSYASGGAIDGDTVRFYSDNTVSGNFTMGYIARGGAIHAGKVYANVDDQLQPKLYERGTTFSGNHTAGLLGTGGAIHATDASRLSQVTFDGNFTTGPYAAGGAIRGVGEVRLRDNSTIQNNRTENNNAGGGGISSGSKVSIDRTSVLNNRTLGTNSPGGGIHVPGGYVTIQNGFSFVRNSTVANNSTVGTDSPGGGVAATGAYLFQSTISGNSTAASNSPGGGVHTSALGLSTSTISGNSTNAQIADTSPGGGLFASDPTRIQMDDSIVLGNYSRNSTSNDFAAPATFSPGAYGLVLVGSTPTEFTPGANSTLGYTQNADPGDVFANAIDVQYDSDFDGVPDTPASPAIKTGELRNLGGGVASIGLKPDLEFNLALDRGANITNALFDLRSLGRTVDLSQPASLSSNVFLDSAGDPQNGGSLFALANQSGSFASNATVLPGPDFGNADLGPTELQSLEPETPSVVVTTVDDVEDPYDLQTSLREAILFANTGDADGVNGELDEITFAPSLAGRTITLVDGELDISQNLIIDASGIGGITIDAAEKSRVVHFESTSGDLELQSLTLTGGKVSDESGGGIRFDSSGVLTLTSSRITNNHTTGDLAGGGGVFAEGRVVVNESLIDGNSTSGILSLGGGLNAETLTINNSTIFGNMTSGTNSEGGGLYADDVTLNNVTIAKNVAEQSAGGGVYGANSAILQNSIVLGNRSGQAASSNEILRGDALSFQEANLVGENSSTFDSDGTSAKNALISEVFSELELTNNGGPMPTVALKPSIANPALDAGFLTNSTGTDQRGLPRSVDLPGLTGPDQIDLGAYELQPDIGELPGVHVTTTLDVIDAFDFATSLREAIIYANDSSAGDLGLGDADNDGMLGDIITFDSRLNGETITLTSQLPTVTSSLTIDGPGANLLTISGNDSSRIFNFDSPGVTQAVIQDIKLTDGAVPRNPQPNPEVGGAIRFVGQGDLLTIRRTIISGSKANGGGGIFVAGAGSTAVTLDIVDSLLVDNLANFSGSAILTGGDSNVIITNSTVSGNESLSGSAALFQQPGNGDSANMIIRNATIANNTGSGVINLGNNSTGVVEVGNTILAGNSGSNMLAFGTGTVQNFSVGNNLSDDGTLPVGTNDQPNTDPMLTSLGDFGGPIPAHALLFSSTAIDGGNDALAVDSSGSALANDQRGDSFPRILGTAVDIGAYENGFTSQAGPPVIQSISRHEPLEEFTSADELGFRLAFSEQVQNVDVTDFILTGGSTAEMTNLMPVQGTGEVVYELTISGGDLASYNGTLGLSLSAGQDIADLDGVLLPQSAPAINQGYTLDNVAPEVEVQDTTNNQSSVVRAYHIQFDGPVTLDAGAFDLRTLGGDVVDLSVGSIIVNGKTLASLTFSGPFVEASGSLMDGDYTLRILSSHVRDAAGNELDGDKNGVAGGDSVDSFFRFFGDTDRDRDVDGQDYGRFGLTFLKSFGDSSFNNELDFDNDGDVDGQDYGKFGLRFLQRLG